MYYPLYVVENTSYHCLWAVKGTCFFRIVRPLGQASYDTKLTTSYSPLEGFCVFEKGGFCCSLDHG